MQRYRLTLTISGIDNVHLVMKLVEGTHGIDSSLQTLNDSDSNLTPVFKKPKKLRKYRPSNLNRSNGATRYFQEHLEQVGMKTFNLKYLGSWCAENGYKTMAPGGIIGSMVREKQVEREGDEFKLL